MKQHLSEDPSSVWLSILHYDIHPHKRSLHILLQREQCLLLTLFLNLFVHFSPEAGYRQNLVHKERNNKVGWLLAPRWYLHRLYHHMLHKSDKPVDRYQHLLLQNCTRKNYLRKRQPYHRLQTERRYFPPEAWAEFPPYRWHLHYPFEDYLFL